MTAFKRKFRKLLISDRNSSFKLNPTQLNILFTIATIAIFAVSQLVINSMLSPLGKELQALNTEKKLIQEENRQLEQEIAQSRSLTLVKKISEEKLQLKELSNAELIHINNESITALR